MAAAERMLDESRPAMVATRRESIHARKYWRTQNRRGLLTKRRVWDIIATNRGMQSNFPSIRLGLMVGIGGSVPMLPSYDIRLGDAVVGRPTSTNGGGYIVRLLEGGAVSKARVEGRGLTQRWRQRTITVTQNMASCSRRVATIQMAVRQGCCNVARFSHNAGFSHQAEFTGCRQTNAERSG
jgi:hypothetical protein